MGTARELPRCLASKHGDPRRPRPRPRPRPDPVPARARLHSRPRGGARRAPRPDRRAPRRGRGGRRPARARRRTSVAPVLPLRLEAGPSRLRARQAAAADRAAQAPGAREGHRREGRDPLRGTRRRRKGRCHQAVHGAPQPAWGPARRAQRADRAREVAVVLPALRRPPAERRRDRAVRPVLAQPRRGRAGHGLLHPGPVPQLHARDAGLRADAHPRRHPPGEAGVLGLARRAGSALRRAAVRPGPAVEAVAHRPGQPRWTPHGATSRARPPVPAP